MRSGGRRIAVVRLYRHGAAAAPFDLRDDGLRTLLRFFVANRDVRALVGESKRYRSAETKGVGFHAELSRLGA